MPVFTAKYAFAARMTGTDALIARATCVPGSSTNCGGPSYFALNVGPPLRGTVAVCGICASTTALRACGVPGTAASTAPASDVGGMRAKSAGNASAATYVQGPSMDGARNQRPASNT